ncbi:glycosyltransferase [Azospirillum thermophilum]|uniref:Glycosyl transferase-like protein n=1 Tax=Azospirillum thermophilum TaxID=2202148 RepID=A0A2S2D0J0_9PROT|nr:glycosyltransferase [Azospirillum thermophilum]AWK90279.1 glycosyl transferase-like protein [Azospirillum thermophilum]
MITPDSGFRLCIDKVTVGADLRVEGWAFHHRHGPCRIEALAGNGSAPPAASAADRLSSGLDRHDVGLSLGTPMADRSGFDLAAVLPGDARAVWLRLGAGGEQAFAPLLVRNGTALHDWRPADGSGIAVMEYGFLTERGPRFAAALPAALTRAHEALGLFAAAPRRPAPLQAPVSIVVPVFGGKPFLAPLLQSLVETVEPCHRIVFVDDGNPDRSITAFLVALGCSLDNVAVVAKPRNEGYPRAVAAGVEAATRLNPDGHVVLLNTDVELPAGWLERLVGPIERMPWIASTTPLTNAGTICGFPAMPDDNAPFLGAAVGEIDAAFAAMAELPPVELPTGVGFCMALNRRVLREIGFFDLEAFGRGYGEEVDWCRRAMRHGFANVAIPNLYVHHKHGGSFSSQEKQGRIAASGEIIRQRYPEFDAEVQDFIRADPLRPLRAAAAAVAQGRLGRPRTVLLFDHAGGGGTAAFRAKEIARLQAAGKAVLLVRPALRPRVGMPDGALDIELLHADGRFDFPANDLADLAALARVLPLSEAVVGSLVGYRAPDAVMAFLRTLRTGELCGREVPLRLLHHDYFPVCPSLNLIDAEDRFCGVPGPERCRACAPANPHFRVPEGGTLDLAAHRRAWQEIFDLADRHVFFSRSALAVMRRAFALRDERVRIIPHLADHVTVAPLPPPPPGPVLRVAVVGGIGVAKGSRMLEAMVRLAEAHRLPVAFELFGNIDRPIGSAHFRDNGPYSPDQLPGLLAERGCHAVFLPSIWPETYCYVLDEVVGLGLPVGVFDIGAPAERLRCWANGFVVSPVTPEAALNALLRVAGGRAAR